MSSPDPATKLVRFLTAAFSGSAVGMALFGTDGRFVAVNDALAALNGVPAEDHLGRRMGELGRFNPRVEAVGAIIDAVLSDGITRSAKFEATPIGGTGHRRTRAICYPLADGEERIGCGVSIIDVTDALDRRDAAVAAAQELAVERSRLVAVNTLARALSEAVSVNDVGRITVASAIEIFDAAHGSLFLVTDDRSSLYLAEQGMPRDTADDWLSVPIDVDAPIGVVVRTGELSLQRSREEIARQFPHLIELAEHIDEQAWATLPVVRPITGHIVGALTLGFKTPQSFDAEESALFESVVGHVATALDRARFFDAEHEGRLAIEAALERVRRIEDVVSIAFGHLDAPDLLAALLRRTGAALGADSAVLFELVNSNQLLRSVSTVGLFDHADAALELDVGDGIAGAAVRSQSIVEWARGDGDHGSLAQLLDPAVVKVVAAPLLHDGSVIGVISVGFHRVVDFPEADRHVLSAIADRIALSIVNQRLIETERRLKARAEALRSVAAQLATASTVAEVAHVMVSDAVLALCAVSGALGLVSDQRDFMHVVASSNSLSTDSPPLVVALRSSNPIGEAVLTGRMTTIFGHEELRRRYPAAADHALTRRGICWVVVPFGSGIADSGAWLLAFADGESLSAATDALEIVAAQCAKALVRARVHETDRHIAAVLQAAMSVPLAPMNPPFRADYHYVLADARLQIGGDWYDFIELPSPGSAMVVVGDVVGSGIGAAATMGQLRSAAHALAPRCRPEEVLEALDRFVTSHPAAFLATVACVLVDTDAQIAQIALAGHLPPLMIRSDGESAFASVEAGPPIGLGKARVSTTVRFAPADTVVLYTDGLVERRGECVDEGMDRLRRVATSLSAADGGVRPGFCRDLTAALLSANRNDDVVAFALSYIAP